jgi:hypothetical protein
MMTLRADFSTNIASIISKNSVPVSRVTQYVDGAKTSCY